ncbi:T6SS immunity protein Tdi1 domain-containing protein [Demetria terragena]|uniref:T6SS immunity protein Tdi1 domain-containing protein n=1 Tax=Demetria terragena TaxID=63959 RepID=UPI000381FD2F|nr:GAD-like domain-containing protein [Demetria terragena]
MSDQFGQAQPGYQPTGQPSFGQATQWDEPAQNPALGPFLQRFAPDPDVTTPSQEFLAYAQDKVPGALVELWANHGLGFYGEQRIAIVDPGEWMGTLQAWLGADVTSVPVAVTSFGHVYHYDSVDGRDRIQCLDPHFGTNVVVGDDLAAFFNEHLPSQHSHLSDLEGPRGGARNKLGPLAPGETYFFDPILALGGQVSPNTLAKGDGREHLEMIHERAYANG